MNNYKLFYYGILVAFAYAAIWRTVCAILLIPILVMGCSVHWVLVINILLTVLFAWGFYGIKRFPRRILLYTIISMLALLAIPYILDFVVYLIGGTPYSNEDMGLIPEYGDLTTKINAFALLAVSYVKYQKSLKNHIMNSNYLIYYGIMAFSVCANLENAALAILMIPAVVMGWSVHWFLVIDILLMILLAWGLYNIKRLPKKILSYVVISIAAGFTSYHVMGLVFNLIGGNPYSNEEKVLISVYDYLNKTILGFVLVALSYIKYLKFLRQEERLAASESNPAETAEV